MKQAEEKVSTIVKEHGLREVLAGAIETIDSPEFLKNMSDDTDDSERVYLIKSLSQAIDWCNDHGIR